MDIAKIIDDINEKQDLKAMNRRLIENAIRLYAEKTHFVYELLQNAEDVGATQVRFMQYVDRLEVLHDGAPFTKSNLQSLCDAANSDKDGDINKIGKFGIGFKSVFAICSIVKLYTEPKYRQIDNALPRSAIQINDYITSSVLEEDWDMPRPYTTKFVFPYDISLYRKPVEHLRADVAQKLKGLGAQVMLFLKNIKTISYEISGLASNLNGSGIYMLDRQLIGENITKVSTIGETGSKERESSYLIFSKPLKNTQRTVDIAFSVNENKGDIQFIRSDSQYISMYFPTETESKLNFIVQAPFDLTPNRSSLEEGSDYNRELIDLICELYVATIFEIKARKWLSLEFISLLPYDVDSPAFLPSWHFYPLMKRTFSLLNSESMIPTIDGDYVTVKEAKIARSAKLIDLFTGRYLPDFLNVPKAKWLPKNFTENSPLRDLHGFMIKELDVQEISTNDLAKLIRENPKFFKYIDDDWLESFYSYLSKDVRNLLGKNGDLATVPFVKTSDGGFSAPFTSERHGRTTEMVANIYKRPVNLTRAKITGDILFVDERIEKVCPEFVSALGLPEPEAFDYLVKELEGEFESDEINEAVNIAQVKRAAHYLRNDRDKAVELFSKWLWVRAIDANGEVYYCNLGTNYDTVFREKDIYGILLSDYLLNIKSESTQNEIFILDEDYYLDAGLEEKDLKELEKLGIKNNVYQKLDETSWQDGHAQCMNAGDFRKNLTFMYITSVLETITIDYKKKQYENACTKSCIVFHMLKNVEKHLKGEWIYGMTRQERRKGLSQIVEILRADSTFYKVKWLFSNEGRLVSPGDISRYELDASIYGEIDEKSGIYDILGFKKTEEDKKDELVQEFYTRFTQAQREAIIAHIISNESEEQIELEFDPDADASYTDFPDEPIKNLQRLKNNISQKYKDAPKVRYEPLIRRVRTSRGKDKEHIRHRYKGYCQMCDNPNRFWEVAEIFNNPNKEMEEMNLSLCPSCATEYRHLRNDEKVMKKFAKNIRNASLIDDTSIPLDDKFVRFTKAHLAEIQTVLQLEPVP